MVSVIIPIYNEEKILTEKFLNFKDLSRHVDLVFVDGGSSDKSPGIAAKSGKVLSCKKGRALQMNKGADTAEGDIFLFLHADAVISFDSIKAIKNIMENENYAGGCLSQRIDKEGTIFRLIENAGNIRAKATGVFYGDQGIFVKKEMFLKIGGFPDVPVMEDVQFTRKLRKKGRVTVLSEKIIVSPRRWEAKGVIRTILFYSLLNILFFLRFPLCKIRSLYGDLR